MFKGDFADGGRVEGQSSADTGAKTPISASRIQSNKDNNRTLFVYYEFLFSFFVSYSMSPKYGIT